MFEKLRSVKLAINPFYRPTEAEKLAMEMMHQQAEAEAARAAIRANRYHLHMANATMNAIQQWREMEDLAQGGGK